MGRAYQKNLKNQYGKPDVTARDVIALSASGTAGVVGNQADILMTDTQGMSAIPVTRAARLEGASAHVSSGISAGTFSVALTQNGAVVASGDVVAGTAYVDLPLKKEDLADVALAAGDTVSLIYTSSVLGSPTPKVSGRIHISLLE